MHQKITNWHVITGGPGSGKTTTINLLNSMGYQTTIEHARHYIDSQRKVGKTVEEIRNNQLNFQLGVLSMQIDQENALSPEDLVFLDRAIPDALAYYYFLNLPVSQLLTDVIKIYKYKKAFILDLLPMVQDYARMEDEKEQKRIHQLLIEVYSSLQIPVVHVPILAAEKRVEYILSNL